MLKTIKNYFDQDKKDLKEMEKVISEMSTHREEIMKLISKEDLQEKTEELRVRVNEGEDLNSILPEAFALVTEAILRTLALHPFKPQLLGAMVLHNGNIAEMKTGEGKTLVATFPAFLNALTGRSVHIYTVNDYLAKRDAEWMGPVYEMLGMSVGYVLTNSSYAERKEAYSKDIVYGTSNEFGFDYLRSNLARKKEHVLIDDLHYAIVDEVDTILIDEARVPLTLSGLSDKPDEDYLEYPKLIEKLNPIEDYELEEDLLRATLTEEGIEKVEQLLGIDNLYSAEHIMKVHRINYALIVKHFMEKEKHYLIQDDKVVMIDAFTGRLMPGRRFADGIQQSIEAKEGIPISPEFIVRGSISYPNLLLKYDKIAGMSGTAKTEEIEFENLYNMHVYEIPTNEPLVRTDYHDVIYKTKKAKYEAILQDVKKVHAEGRPILLGTESVEESQLISDMLEENGLKHEVLNAKNHAKEAEIIKHAGKLNSITVITNMAGRGTDIKLGQGVNEIGGLHVIGTTRHENRRIDNQLRGRAGRQGDNGSTQIYVSLEDELIQRYGGEQVRVVLNKIKVDDDMPIEHPMASKLVEQIQIHSEATSSSNRQFVKQYDDILNNQRDVIYESRQNVLLATPEQVKEQLFIMYEEVAEDIVSTYCSSENPSEWELNHVAGSTNRFLFKEDMFTEEDFKGLETTEEIVEKIKDRFCSVYNRKESHVGLETLAEVTRSILLSIVDKNWIEHISTMDYLRQGLGMRSQMGNAFLDFSMETYDLFDELIFKIKQMATINTVKLQLQISKSTE